jgi:pSer/pThr/pTyr-binding forkhead associated (FHA) protein
MMQPRRVPRYDAGKAAMPGLQLLHAGEVIALDAGTVSIGRGSTCRVIIQDVVASRFHARITTDAAAGSTLEDLGSANGTWLNGARIASPQKLAAGDRIAIGQVDLHVVDAESPSSKRSPNPTPPKAVSGTSDSTDTGGLDSLELYSKLVEKALAEGEAERMESILSAQLRNIVQTTKERGFLRADSREFLARYGVRVASAAKRAYWIDGLVVVFTIARQPLPSYTIDQLEVCERSTLHKIDRAAFKAYVELLRGLKHRLPPAERQLVQRISSLEHALLASAGAAH